jgi:anthranilate phosphoribosyltransferase
LEALGVNLDITPESVEKCITEIGIGFLFAPALHGAMKYAIGPRKEIGIRTIFNILGPLTNPAGADCQVLGVYREDLTEKMAHVLRNLGCKRGFVVHGMDGMDEGPHYGDPNCRGNCRKSNTIFNRPTLACPMGWKSFNGGDAKKRYRDGILAGGKRTEADIVLLNAAFDW